MPAEEDQPGEDQAWADQRVSPENRGPWPLVTGLSRDELRSYLDATADRRSPAGRACARAGRWAR